MPTQDQVNQHIKSMSDPLFKKYKTAVENRKRQEDIEKSKEIELTKKEKILILDGKRAKATMRVQRRLGCSPSVAYHKVRSWYVSR